MLFSLSLLLYFHLSLPNLQQMNAQEIANEADIIVAPLMDLLDGKLSAFAQCCERTVLKRLLKELWKMAIHTLEKVSSDCSQHFEV